MAKKEAQAEKIEFFFAKLKSFEFNTPQPQNILFSRKFMQDFHYNKKK